MLCSRSLLFLLLRARSVSPQLRPTEISPLGFCFTASSRSFCFAMCKTATHYFAVSSSFGLCPHSTIYIEISSTKTSHSLCYAVAHYCFCYFGLVRFHLNSALRKFQKKKTKYIFRLGKTSNNVLGKNIYFWNKNASA